MIIKAIFPAGVTELIVHGLHQWNYGQQLEIAAEALPAMVEVHFACTGMETAVVRNCAVVGGKVTAAIPDRCLEQTTPVVAWVYAIGETSGETILTVKMPIIARAQPQLAATPPEKVSDKYTEAVAAMNTLVDEYEKRTDEMDANIEAAVQRVVTSTPDFACALKLTPADVSINSHKEFEITETGLYLVLFQSEGESTASSLILITDLLSAAWGTSAYCANPDGDLGYASACYSPIVDSIPMRTQVLFVRHSDDPQLNIDLFGVYKIADIT